LGGHSSICLILKLLIWFNAIHLLCRPSPWLILESFTLISVCLGPVGIHRVGEFRHFFWASLATLLLILEGAMPARTYTKGIGVGFKHPVIKCHVSFRTTSTFLA